jgi:Fe-S-cluster containining protein
MGDGLPDCLTCGLCCRKPAGRPEPYPEDLARWAAEGASGIAGRLARHGGDGCPFLVVGSGFRCSIYPTRPLVCRHFAVGGSACLDLRRKAGEDDPANLREIGFHR